MEDGEDLLQHIPVHRRARLLRRLRAHAELLTGGDIRPLITDPKICLRPANAVLLESRVAVWGEDGRYHLRIGDRLLCGPAAHRQDYTWWTDGTRYRRQQPTLDSLGHYERRYVQWSAALTDEVTDPASVPKRRRCPINETFGDWPPYQGPGNSRAKIRTALIAAFGSACQACRAQLGVFIDHDHDTGMVRGLLCPDCNGRIDGCPHPAGCIWADYLNDPPAAALNLRYPR